MLTSAASVSVQLADITEPAAILPTNSNPVPAPRVNDGRAGPDQLDGLEVVTMSQDERARLRNHKIGFVFQNFNLFPHLSVLDNIMLSALGEPVDPDFEEVTEGEEADRKEKLKSRWAALEKVVGAQPLSYQWRFHGADIAFGRLFHYTNLTELAMVIPSQC